MSVVNIEGARVGGRLSEAISRLFMCSHYNLVVSKILNLNKFNIFGWCLDIIGRRNLRVDHMSKHF